MEDKYYFLSSYIPSSRIWSKKRCHGLIGSILQDKQTQRIEKKHILHNAHFGVDDYSGFSILILMRQQWKE